VLSGQVVKFSTESGFAAFGSPSALTDSSGTANVVMSPATTTTSGADKVVVTATIDKVTVTASIGFSVIAGTVAQPSIKVTLSSASIAIDKTATVTAVVRDASGVGLSGQIVNFITSAGLGAFSAPSAITDSNGVATVTLRPNDATSVGADKVVGSVTLTTTSLTDSAVFQIAQAGTVPQATLTLSVSSTSVTGSGPTDVTAILKDSSGIGVPNQIVQFSTLGAFSSLSSPSALTDTTGTAKVTLKPASATASGADTVVGTTTLNSKTLTANAVFQVIPGSVVQPTLSVDLSSTGLTANSPITAKATLKDSAGAPLANQIVQFTTVSSLGVFSAPSALTDSTGVASVTLRPASNTTIGADRAVATASLVISGVTTSLTNSAAFQVTPVVVAQPTLTVTLSSTTITSASPANVTAVLKDSNGIGVAGQIVQFSTFAGLGVFSAQSALTDGSGVATVTLRPQSGLTSGADRVTASSVVSSTALSASAVFQLAAGSVPQPTISVAVSSTTVTNASSTTVTATVKDASNNALSGQVVQFSTSSGLGALSAPSGLTDLTGTTSVTLRPATSTTVGADRVVASTSVTSIALSDSKAFEVKSASASTPSLAVSLSSTNVTVASPGTVVATLTDSLGSGIPNQIVTFTTAGGLGKLGVATALTGADGKTTAVQLQPATATTTGADRVVATTTVNGTALSANAVFQATSVVVGQPTLSVSLCSGTPCVATTTVSAGSPATVKAVANDSTGAGVAGQVVQFASAGSLGAFSAPSALTDATGSAVVTLRPATNSTAGADQVVATTTVNSTALTASVGYQLTPTLVSISSFSSDLASGSSLSAYGQANLTVSLSGVSATSPVTVTLSSTCVAKSKATLTPSSVTTSTGTATFTYRDGGCGSTDTVDSLQVSVSGSTATSSLSLPLTPPSVTSISFSSALPTNIYLKGSGYTESALITFQVRDSAGNGVPGKDVKLSLVNSAGKATIDSQPDTTVVTKTSDSSGNVTVRVNSGTVPTALRVSAVLGSISTVSSSLSVAVGLPSQLNFSLDQAIRNIEGFDNDGTVNTYTVIASDRLGNPVPDGTAVNFVAEGGQIVANQLTAAVLGIAQASARYASASPRPADGRVTILAYALGEESFIDANGDNIFTPAEDFQDLGDLFISRPYLAGYNQLVGASGTAAPYPADQLIGETAANGTVCKSHTSPILVLDATIPSRPNTCDGNWGKAYVRRAIETVLSTSTANPVWGIRPSGFQYAPGGLCENKANFDSPSVSRTYYTVQGSTLFGVPSSGGTLSFFASDSNTNRFNPLPAGTTVSVRSTSGLSATVNGGSPVPSTYSPTSVTLGYTWNGVTSGTITISFTTPKGLVTSVGVYLDQGAAPPGYSACP
jgi:hypothetical protein